MSEFPTTRWSLVGRAHADNPEVRRQALSELLRQYAPALRSYLIHRHRLPSDRAEDVLQAFLADRVLSQAILARADQSKGRFRNFVLTALQRFALNEARGARAKKRSPQSAVSLDAEAALPVAAPGTRDPFETTWAREVLSRAVARTREECLAAGRQDVWGIFDARVLAPAMEGAEPLDYATLVERFKLASPTQASNLLVTATRSFRKALREVIGEYEPDEKAVDEEIADLLRVLSR